MQTLGGAAVLSEVSEQRRHPNHVGSNLQGLRRRYSEQSTGTFETAVKASKTWLKLRDRPASGKRMKSGLTAGSWI